MQKSHAVCIPFPAQGHINPMLKLAKILNFKGFHITFVNTEFNHQRLLKSQGSETLNRYPSFQFETIPDGLPPQENLDATQDMPPLFKSSSEKCLEPFKRLLTKLNATTLPVSCIVSDGAMSFTLDAAEELGIPDVLFWTPSACGLLGYAHYITFKEKELIPLKDPADLTNGYLDTIVDCIPSMKGMRLKDMPTLLRTTNPEDILINFLIRETSRSKKASAIILNTFDELESDVLNELSSIYPRVYTIGPLHTVANSLVNKDLQLLGSSLWKEETECLEWLDSKEPNSVVYVNFGSITVITPEQLNEISWGLANSNQNFLWIIRPDLVSGDSQILGKQFMEATNDRGLLASWCPQEKVLNHPSVDPSDECSLIKGMEELEMNKDESHDYVDDEYLSLNGTLYHLKVNTFPRFLSFLDLIKIDKLVFKNWEIMGRKFIELLGWFYYDYMRLDVLGELPPVIGVIRIDLLALYKFVDDMGGYMNVSFNDMWGDVAIPLGLTREDGHSVKECYREYIALVKVYYEEARRSGHEEPRLNMVGDVPFGDARTGVHVEEAQEEKPKKRFKYVHDEVKKEEDMGCTTSGSSKGNASNEDDFIIVA